MGRDDIEVRALRSAEALAPLRDEIDALNLASRRPCPFATYGYVRATIENDEYAAPGDELLFLCAFRGERLVGYLPLKRSTETTLGVRHGKISLLVWHDTDRPHVVARDGDERVCSEAFFRHLARRERWSSLELVFQDEASALWPVPHLPAWRYYVRRYPNEPNTTIPLGQASLGEFFQRLPGDFRNTVSRMTRRVARAGRVEWVSSHDRAAAPALLELYLDLERRSWKAAAQAGLDRHPRRLAFFRSLCGPEQPLQLAFDLVLLDGVPIAAMMSGMFAGGYYALETTYDSAYADLSPGYLTWLLAIRHGIVEGLRSYNLQSAYSYYKARWNGVNTPTWAVQVFRIPGLPYLRARAGDLKRRFLGAGGPPPAFNETKRTVAEKSAAEVRPSREADAARAEAVLSALVRDGVRVERRSGDSLADALPFELDGGAKPRRRSA